MERRVLILGIALVAAGACRRSLPPAPSGTQLELAPWEVSKDSALLFTYVEASGKFATVDKAEDVPANSRKLVRVMDPAKGVTERRDTARVYVVDLAELLDRGKSTARALSREAFETGALAQLPPGESNLLAGPHGPALADEPVEVGADAGLGRSSAGPPVVTLYGTPWCGACKAARQYLASRHIPFAYKNIESDPAAARELQEKAARLGIPADRVPILDVRGRLLVGFDRARLETLLGDAT